MVHPTESAPCKHMGASIWNATPWVDCGLVGVAGGVVMTVWIAYGVIVLVALLGLTGIFVLLGL